MNLVNISSDILTIGLVFYRHALDPGTTTLQGSYDSYMHQRVVYRNNRRA